MRCDQVVLLNKTLAVSLDRDPSKENHLKERVHKTETRNEESHRSGIRKNKKKTDKKFITETEQKHRRFYGEKSSNKIRSSRNKQNNINVFVKIFT